MNENKGLYKAALRIKYINMTDKGNKITLQVRNKYGVKHFSKTLFVAPMERGSFQFLAYAFSSICSIVIIYILFRIAISIAIWRENLIKKRDFKYQSFQEMSKFSRIRRHFKLWRNMVYDTYPAVFIILNFLVGMGMGYLLYI